jgi:hypothetical protein
MGAEVIYRKVVERLRLGARTALLSRIAGSLRAMI